MLVAGALWVRQDPRRPEIAATLRKCVAAGRAATYTDGACPPGSRQQAVDGGTVTVVASPRPAASGAAHAGGHVRDLLLDPAAVDIKARRIEETIGK